jgi:hypothetical protein
MLWLQLHFTKTSEGRRCSFLRILAVKALQVEPPTPLIALVLLFHGKKTLTDVSLAKYFTPQVPESE